MARYERSVHHDAFAAHGDFNEQLYTALRNSPWWMISIAVHVVIFLIAALLSSDIGPKDEAPQMQVTAAATPPEEEAPPTPIDTKQVHEHQIPVQDPIIKNEEQVEPEVDVDLPFEQLLGEDGLSDAPFHAPATNGELGLGGGAGAFAGRGLGGNNDGGNGGGGTPEARDAVDDALRWLAAHQSPNGGWEAAGFDKWCDGRPQAQGPEGLGRMLYDPGVTGLALCAFLGAGYSNRGQHEYSRVVAKGLRYLKNVQDAEGCFGPRTSQHFIYNHATAALAMVEAFGMSESPIYRSSAQKALDFIAVTRNPYFAWRYGVKPGDNDTSVTGWMMMALKSARLINADAVGRGRPAPLVIDEEAFDGVLAWIEKMTDTDTGRVGYIQRGSGPARPQELIDRFPADRSESMTGVGILARVFIGEPVGSRMVQLGAEVCSRRPPTWNPSDGSIDMYYWYYATLGMFQVGGRHWKAWNQALKSAVIDNQREDTDYCLYKGSWDPLGPWGPDGGRVYSTALMAMCLEVYYRYDRVFGAGGR